MRKSKTFIALAGAFAGVLALSPVVDAAKGGNGNGGNGGKDAGIAVVVDDGVYAGTTQAAVVAAGDGSVLATAATGEEYWVRARCKQGDAIVYEQFEKTEGSLAVFTLGPTYLWTGGAADCTADTGYLRGGKWVSTSSTSFHTAAG